MRGSRAAVLWGEMESGAVDAEHGRKVYRCVENLLHGLAVYSGVGAVARLGGVAGLALWVLAGVGVLAPLVLAVR